MRTVAGLHPRSEPWPPLALGMPPLGQDCAVGVPCSLCCPGSGCGPSALAGRGQGWDHRPRPGPPSPTPPSPEGPEALLGPRRGACLTAAPSFRVASFPGPSNPTCVCSGALSLHLGPGPETCGGLGSGAHAGRSSPGRRHPGGPVPCVSSLGVAGDAPLLWGGRVSVAVAAFW